MKFTLRQRKTTANSVYNLWQEKWKFKTEDTVHSSPAVANGMVFFGSDDNYLYAVE